MDGPSDKDREEKHKKVYVVLLYITGVMVRLQRAYKKHDTQFFFAELGTPSGMRYADGPSGPGREMWCGIRVQVKECSQLYLEERDREISR